MVRNKLKTQFSIALKIVNKNNKKRINFMIKNFVVSRPHTHVYLANDRGWKKFDKQNTS